MAVAAEAEKLRAKRRAPGRSGRGRAALPHAPAHQRRGDRGHRQQRHQVHGGGRYGRAARRHRQAPRRRLRLRLPREDCIASVGGKHALFNAIQVLVDHGDEVILPVPYWVSFKDIVRYAGGEPVYIPTDERHDFALTADMVERAITPRTKVIILNSPNNPSGAVMDPEHMAEVLRLAHDRGIYVVSDECYVYLNHTGQQVLGGLRA